METSKLTELVNLYESQLRTDNPEPFYSKIEQRATELDLTAPDFVQAEIRLYELVGPSRITDTNVEITAAYLGGYEKVGRREEGYKKLNKVIKAALKDPKLLLEARISLVAIGD